MNAILDKVRSTTQNTEKQFTGQIVILLNGAFAFVAALAWNEAVKALIDRYLVFGSGLISKFIYAALVTLLVVFVAARLSQFSGNK